MPLGVGECVQVRFSVASCQKSGFEAIKNFIAVTLKMCCLVLPDHIEVALWKAVSTTKLVLEISHSLGSVNSLASMLPSAFRIRILVDAHTGISTADCECNVTDTGHASICIKTHLSQHTSHSGTLANFGVH